MKKMVVFTLVTCLMVPFLSVIPAQAGRFWPGLAVGVGSAILLSQLFQPPRVYYYYTPRDYRYDYPRIYTPPAYYCPPPAVYRDRWVPGHWVETVGPFGQVGRYWASGHWERY